MNRRDFLKGIAAASLFSSSLLSCRSEGAVKTGKRVLILGIDGMDPSLLRQYINQGIMPSFERLANVGRFSPLMTTIPPQSPVVWASFATGTNPGGHGIFDFIHRDPKTYIPYLSTSRVIPASMEIDLAGYQIPIKGGKVENLRGGRAFFEYLDRERISHTIIKLPSNFPPTMTRYGHSLSGMGTPDLQGTYGTFTLFTSINVVEDSEAGGGEIIPVNVFNNRVEMSITGPKNPFSSKKETTYSRVQGFLDPSKPLLLLKTSSKEILLKEGEWSDFVSVDFPMLGSLKSFNGIVRFYLRSIRPDFQLYVTPVNIAPRSPDLPISQPSSYAASIAEQCGDFYTQGFPENTKSLTTGVLTDAEYLNQAYYILDESEKQFNYEWKRFRDGLLFYYFSSLDQNSHVLWRAMDETHPAYSKEICEPIKHELRNMYIRLDKLLGRVLKDIGTNDTLFICSDHGFASFKYGFNINTWLHKNNYLYLKEGAKPDGNEALMDVDWEETRAYSYGFNGVYINKAGREGRGIVSSREEQALIDEIKTKLEAEIDPNTKIKPISRAYKARDVYSGRYLPLAPDIVVGFERDYRSSWENAIGKITEIMLKPNKGKWSGDHCIDYRRVPGVLLSNLKINKEYPAIWDLAPSILKIFGIKDDGSMTGKSLV